MRIIILSLIVLFCTVANSSAATFLYGSAEIIGKVQGNAVANPAFSSHGTYDSCSGSGSVSRVYDPVDTPYGEWNITTRVTFHWSDGSETYVTGGVSRAAKDWYIVTTGDCEPPPDCSEQFEDLKYECGGESLIENFNEQTCEGNCYCDERPVDNPSTNTYAQLAAFCGGRQFVKHFDSQSCYGSCKGCDEEYEAAVIRCAQQGFAVDLNSPNADECVYDCLGEPCQEDYEALEKGCGFWGVGEYNWDTCEGECAEKCNQTTYDDFVEGCGVAGVAYWNNETCSGKCNSCDEIRKTCDKSCPSGFGNLDCTVKKEGGKITYLNYSDCECMDPADVLPPPEDPATGEPTGEGEDYEGNTYYNGVPGSHGGTVVKNPNGSYTETVANGEQIVYDADGKTVTGYTHNGQTLISTLNDDGSITYTGTDGEGNYQEVTVTDNGDGTTTTFIENGTDLNWNNPELEPNHVSTSVTTTTTENTTTIGGDEVAGGGDGEITIPGGEVGGEPEEPEEPIEANITELYPSNQTYAYGERVNTTGWTSAKANWATKNPSAIFANTVTPIIETMRKAPEVPVFEVPLIGGSSILPDYSVKIDLSYFDMIIPVFKFFLGLSMLLITIRNIPNIWAGAK